MASRQQTVIKNRKWSHKNLSMTIGVMHQPNKNRLIEVLSTIDLEDDGISQSKYKICCAEKFIIDFPTISNKIYEKCKNSSEIKSAKESLFNIVKKVNPLLNPKKVYISNSNTLTLHKTDYLLEECAAWSKSEDLEQVFDTNLIYRATDRAENYPYKLHSERWKAVGFSVQIKEFRPSHKVDLVFGFEPKDSAQKKMFFVALCVDNLHLIRNQIENNPETADLSPNKIVEGLYELVVKHNKWTKMSVNQFKRINEQYTGAAKETAVGLETETSTKSYKSLKKVPKKKIQDLEYTLKSVVFGQDAVIEDVCKKIRKAYAGLKPENSPIGVFLFYGGTSTGKTELCRMLAKELMGTKSSLIKIDCNTLQQEHTLSTLLGAPPSYVGYEEGGILSKELLDNPFRVVLFDEVEKATPRLFDYVLSFIDEGEAYDKRGNLLNFSECLFIFTSNIGQKESNNAIINKIGFSAENADESILRKKEFSRILNKNLKPEFIARLNVHGGMYYFPELNKNSLINVADKYFNSLIKNLKKENNIDLSIDPKVSEKIVEKALTSNKRSHARNIITEIETTICDNLTDQIINNNLSSKKKNNVISVNVNSNDEFEIEFEK